MPDFTGELVAQRYRLCQIVGKGSMSTVYVGEDTRQGTRNRSNVQEVKRALLQQVPKSSVPLLEMKETDGTHQKILICDDLFAIAGSFNWLSYRGERDKGYRREIGALFRDPDEVGELIKIALEVLS